MPVCCYPGVVGSERNQRPRPLLFDGFHVSHHQLCHDCKIPANKTNQEIPRLDALARCTQLGLEKEGKSQTPLTIFADTENVLRHEGVCLVN